MKKYDYKRAIIDNIKEWALMNGVIPHAQKEHWSKEDLADMAVGMTRPRKEEYARYMLRLL